MGETFNNLGVFLLQIMATRIEFTCEIDPTDYLLIREVDGKISVNIIDSLKNENKEIILDKNDCLILIKHLQSIYNKL